MAEEVKKQSWFAKHKILTGFLVIIVIGTIGNAMNGGSTTTSSTTASPTPVATQEITYEKVDAKSFIAEFDENQLSAESKYKSKYVELKAKIKNISEDIGGTPFLSLEPANAGEYYMGTTIKCSFKSKDELMNVKNDQAITVKGQVKSQTLGIINLDKCSLTQ